MRGNRFPVVPVERRTVDGIVFASGREAKRYAELKLLERAGEISRLELQPAFPVLIKGQTFCTYTADFSYFERGYWIVEDVKSSGTAKDAAYRLRKKAAVLFHSITVREAMK